MAKKSFNFCKFIELLVEAIDNLTSHSYIAATYQTKFLKKRTWQYLSIDSWFLE